MKEHMGDQKHGLMVYDAAGKLVKVMPGHMFGRTEIVDIIENELGA